jgi:hypothetical protein
MNKNYVEIKPIRYVLKKDIPFRINKLKKGDIIDQNYSQIGLLDLSDTNYFEVYFEPIYQVGEQLLYKKNRYTGFELYDVITGFNGKQYRIKNVKTGQIEEITDKTVGVKKLTKFWFINSNGQICSDYEERRDINKEGLEYKKKIGNYFSSLEIAREYKNALLNQ